MKKENILLKILAFFMSIGLWVTIIAFVFIGGIQPICTSVMKNIVEEQFTTENMLNVVENSGEITPEQQAMLNEVVVNNPEIEELMGVYLEGVGNMLTTGDMNLQDTSEIYDKLNDDIIDATAKAKNIEISDEKRAQLKLQLAAKEAELEAEVNKTAKQSMDSMNPSAKNVLGVYGALFKEETRVVLGVVIAVLCIIIILLRWKTKGWLTTIGLTGITSSIMIFLIPAILSIAEKIVLEGRYSIGGKGYFVTAGIIVLAIGIVMLGIKQIAFRTKKVDDTSQML